MSVPGLDLVGEGAPALDSRLEGVAEARAGLPPSSLGLYPGEGRRRGLEKDKSSMKESL